MLKKLFNLCKKVVFYCFLLYGFNLLAVSLNLMIPINFFTVGTLTIFGIPSFFSLILIQILIY